MRVDEARDHVLDIMREGINGGLLSVVVSCTPHRHDSVLLTMTDGTEVVVRITNITEDSASDLDVGERPLPDYMKGTWDDAVPKLPD